MFLRRRNLFLLIVALVLSLALAGCVRPAPDDGAGEAESTAVTAPDLSDPDVGGGLLGDLSEEELPYPIVTEAEPTAETAVAQTTPTATPEPVETVEESAEEVAEAAEETEEVAETEATQAEEEVAPPTVEAETPPSAAAGEISHVVQPNENLYRIGLQYGVSWVALAQYNGITNPNDIRAGQTIRIPPAGAPLPAPTPTPPGPTVLYVVQAGDNLYRIGQRFGVSWVQIAEANGLDNPNQVYAGQTLKIPTSLPGPTPEFTHVVRQGETIFRIAQLYGVSWTAIAEANEIESPYTIYAGQTLIIPGS